MQTTSARLSYARALFMFGVLSACAHDAPDAHEAAQPARSSLETQREIVAQDGFESGGFSALPWSARGDARVLPEAARSGEFGARLGGVSAVTARFSTRARRGLQVTFDVKGVGLERREYLSVEYSLNGLRFVPLARERGDGWSHETVRLPALLQDRANVSLRFSVRAVEGRRDQGFEGVYLDNVVISAASTAPPDAGPPDAGTGCMRDEDCAAESTACNIGMCEVATRTCTSVPRAEGTPCGDGRRCDARARCLACGDAASTFQLLQSAIFDAPTHGCATGGICHGASPGAARLNLTPEASYAQLVNVTSTLSTLLRVAPGSPSDSFLYRKLAWATNGTPVMGGGPMPAGGRPPVPARMLAGLGAWITDGAPADGFVRGTLENLCQAPCSSDADCGDANACNGIEQCVAGSCSAGVVPRCDDGRACTSDRCDPASGCLNVPSPGLPCGDGGACDAAGACQCEAGNGDPSCEPPTGQPTGQLTLRWDFPTPEGV
jgi:hypothetical protein